MWAFGVEHWQQATAQATSPTDVNRITTIDAETLQQAVTGALARSEIAREMSDADVVPELYPLLGMHRLLVMPEAVPPFAAAVRSYREHRMRTAAARIRTRGACSWGSPSSRASSSSSSSKN